MIKARKLSLLVNKKKTILSDVDFDLEAGEIVGIVGKNGAGKSSLMKILSGLQSPSQGTITYNDKSLGDYSAQELATWRSILSQERSISFELSVLDILLMGRYPHRPISNKDYTIIDQVISDLDLSNIMNTPYYVLSGGEKQKVQFGRVLCQLFPLEKNTHKVLFLDEPLAALDLSVQQKLLHYINELVQKFNLSVVMVLHDLNWTARFCSRVYLLENGQCVAEGTPQHIFTKSNLKKYFDVKSEIVTTTNHHISMVFQ